MIASTRTTTQRLLAGAVAVLALLLGVTACSNDSLAEQYREGSGKNFVAGDGTITEWPVESRGEPVVFSGETDTGATVGSADTEGQVVVVNFWYAACAPCRAEAPDLEAVNVEYADEPVSFIGVNVRDQPATAAGFAKTYGVTYPSIIDLDKDVALAFAGQFAPNAVPTTLVLDREGRVAARILGELSAPSILSTIVGDLLEENLE